MTEKTPKEDWPDLRSLKTHQVVGWTMTSDPELRAAACLELGEREIPTTGVELYDNLEDPEALVREAAARAIGQVKGPGARHFLESLAGDPAETVRAAAKNSLDRLDEPRPASPAPPSVRGDEIDGLLRKARHFEPKQRAEALWQLAGVKESGVADLMVEKLEDPFPLVRARAAAYLARHPRGSVQKRLIELMEDPDHRVRQETARALGTMRAGLVNLLEALGDDFLVVRLAATGSLVRMGGERIIREIHHAAREWVPGSPWLLEGLLDLDEGIDDHLHEWLEHPYTGVRGMALEWILDHRERRLRGAVERLLRDPETWLRSEADAVLRAL